MVDVSDNLMEKAEKRDKISRLKEKEENLYQNGAFSQGDVKKQQKLNERIEELADQAGIDPSEVTTPEENPGPTTVETAVGVTQEEIESGVAEQRQEKADAQDRQTNARNRKEFIKESGAEKFRDRAGETITKEKALNRLDQQIKTGKRNEQIAQKNIGIARRNDQIQERREALNRRKTVQQATEFLNSVETSQPEPRTSGPRTVGPAKYPSIGRFEAQDVDPEETVAFNSPEIIEENPGIQGVNNFFEEQVAEDLAIRREARSKVPESDDITTPGEFLGRGASILTQTGLQTGKEAFDFVSGGDASLEQIDVSSEQAFETGDEISRGLQTTFNSPEAFAASADLVTSGTAAAFTGAATDEFNIQRALPPLSTNVAEAAKENPSQVGSQLLFGAAVTGPTSSFTSPVLRQSADNIGSASKAGVSAARKAGSKVKKQASKGGPQTTTFRDFVEGDLPSRKATPEEVQNQFSEEDILMGRNVPDIKKSGPTTEMSRREFIERIGLPSGKKPEDLAGKEFGKTSKTEKILGKIGDELPPQKRKGQLYLKTKQKQVDPDTTDTVSLRDRVEKIRDNIRPLNRRDNDFDTDSRKDIDSGRRQTEFNKPENKNLPDLGKGVGLGLGAAAAQETGLDQPQDQDPVPENKQDFEEKSENIFDFENKNDLTDFTPFTPKDFDGRRRKQNRDRDADRIRNRRDRDLENSGEKQFNFDREKMTEEEETLLSDRFATSLTAGLLGIEATESFNPEEFTGTGFGIRPLKQQ